MDNFNLRNMQLAYQAIYDQNLCESMEELGIIGGDISEQDNFETWVNELLDEGYDLSDYTWDELYEGYKKLPVGKMIRQAAKKGEEFSQNYHSTDRLLKTEKQLKKMARVADRHSLIKGKGKVRGQGQAALNRIRGEMKEDYDAFDVVLEYLLDEGYADSLESAEAIMVNMSEEWIEGILEEREPGVKPYRPAPTQSEVRRDASSAERRRINSGKDVSGYGPDEKFYKPEDKRIPDKDTAEWFRRTVKKFGRPIGRYNPGTIRTQDIINRMPKDRRNPINTQIIRRPKSN